MATEQVPAHLRGRVELNWQKWEDLCCCSAFESQRPRCDAYGPDARRSWSLPGRNRWDLQVKPCAVALQAGRPARCALYVLLQCPLYSTSAPKFVADVPVTKFTIPHHFID